MKKIMYCLLSVGLLDGAHIFSFGKKTFFGTRSQGLDEVTELVGWQKLIYKYDAEKSYGTYSATLKYSRSFQENKITEFLWGDSTLNFTGSAVMNRKDTDVL